MARFEIQERYMGWPDGEPYEVEVNEEVAAMYRAGGAYNDAGEWAPLPFGAVELDENGNRLDD